MTAPPTSPVHRARGRPNIDEAERIDRAIREAALHELFANGEAATLNAVAKTAGLARKTVYARYSNKHDMFVDAMRHLVEQAQPMSFDRSGSLEDRVASYIEAAFSTLASPYAQAFRRLFSLSPEFLALIGKELVELTRITFFEPALALVREAQHAGEIDERAAPEELARLIMSLAFSSRSFPDFHSGEEQSATPDYARFIARQIVHGIGRDHRPAP